MKSLKYILLATAILTTSCIATGSDAEPSAEYITEGMQVPEFTVTGNRERTFRSPEDFRGKTTLLLFFASWCPQCQGELPEVNKAWEALRGDPQYAVVAVSRGGASGKYEQSASILQKYWNAHNLSMPWFLDGDRSVFDKFASADIPRAYIVNAYGTVVWKAALPKLKAADYAALLKRFGSGNASGAESSEGRGREVPAAAR